MYFLLIGRTILSIGIEQNISTELSDESTNISSKNEEKRQVSLSLILLLTFKLGKWRKRGEGNDFGGNTPLLNVFSVLGQKGHPSILQSTQWSSCGGPA